MADQNEPAEPTQGGTSQPSPPADGSIDQSEIEALLGAAGKPTAEGGGSSAPESSPKPESGETPESDVAIRQEEIEKLFSNSGANASAGGDEDAVESVKPDAVSAGSLNQGDIEFLLNRAEEALKSIDAGSDELPSGVMAFQFQELGGSPPSTESATLDLVSEVELDLKIELGRTHMYLEDVLRLRRGAVVPLDKLAGDPVDIFVNDRLIARGEVLVLNDNFCVRVAELVAGATFE